MTVSLRFFSHFHGQLEVDVRLPHEQHEFDRRSNLLLPEKHVVCAASMRLPGGYHGVIMMLFDGHITGATVSVH